MGVCHPPAMTLHAWTVVCPEGAEEALREELAALGAVDGALQEGSERARGRVHCLGDLAFGYRASLGAFLAHRVLLHLWRAPCRDGDELYDAARLFAWGAHLRPGERFAIRVTSHPQQRWIARQFALQRLKDAVVDAFRDAGEERPLVDRDDPRVLVHLHVDLHGVDVSLDVANAVSLHQRGHARPGAEAPLRESLAALVLHASGAFPVLGQDFAGENGGQTGSADASSFGEALVGEQLGAGQGEERGSTACGSGEEDAHAGRGDARAGGEADTVAAASRRSSRAETWAFSGCVCDPMAGSGTLLWEAAAMWTRCVPGLRRGDRAPEGWMNHEAHLWRDARESFAEAHRAALRERGAMRLVAFDVNAEAMRQLEMAAARVPWMPKLETKVRALKDAVPPSKDPGLVVCNPPYGQRLLDATEAVRLHAQLGDVLRQRFLGWRSALITETEMAKCIGLRSRRRIPTRNGAIDCRVLVFDIASTAPARIEQGRGGAGVQQAGVQRAGVQQAGVHARRVSARATELAARLRKNEAKLASWAKQTQTNAYRVFDGDIPGIRVSIDRFDSAFVVYDHFSRQQPPTETRALLRDIEDALGEVATGSQVVFKRRGARQSTEERSGRSAFVRGETQTHEVLEHGLRFEVNVHDYLDCGLFMEERVVRKRLAKEASGRDVLNLFAYTCTASVYAVSGGARSCTSVDWSSKYLHWGRRNALRNAQPEQVHRFVEADCMAWLMAEQKTFGLIYLAPPIASVSKRGASMSLVEDLPAMVEACLRRLAREGALWISLPVPELDLASLPSLRPLVERGLRVQEESESTQAKDFSRTGMRRRTWRLCVMPPRP